MLKITVVDTAYEQELVVEGSLMAPYLSELERAWEKARDAHGAHRCIVDLRNATFIDHYAERILLSMKREGARFIACGVSTKHRLEELGIECK